MTVNAHLRDRTRTAPADARIYTMPVVREIPPQPVEGLRSTVW